LAHHAPSHNRSVTPIDPTLKARYKEAVCTPRGCTHGDADDDVLECAVRFNARAAALAAIPTAGAAEA
jgi:hypothetical protein